MSIDKLNLLREILTQMERVLVAYSGGVDSTFLLKVATETLGSDCLGIIGVSPSLAEDEFEAARSLADEMGARLKIVETEEILDPNYASNPVNRCYYCKSELYDQLVEWRIAESAEWICDGTNLDDVGDWRPGMEAAREHGVRSPLREAGLTKAEIRELSRHLGLPTWNKPAMACLSSRLPYGTPVTPERLQMIDHAERAVRSFGVRQLRVRHHVDVTGAEMARLEIDPDELTALLDPEIMRELARQLKAIGYRHVTLDLLGYRRGSANEALREEQPAEASLIPLTSIT